MRQNRGKKIRHYSAYVLMVLILFAGVFAAGSVRGFFGEPDQTATPLTVEEVSGNVSLTRSGVSFYVREDFSLRIGDLLSTAEMAGLRITDGERDYHLSEKTEVLITDAKIQVLSGSLTVQEGDREKSLAAGESVSYLEENVFLAKEEESSPVKPESEEQTSAAPKTEEDRKETTSAIQTEEDQEDLEEEQQTPQAESAAETVTQKTESSAAQEITSAEEQPEETDAASKPDSQRAEAETSGAKPEEETTTQEETEIAAEPEPESVISCFVEIRCDTVLQNMDLLSAEKRSVIPSDGVILAAHTVTLSAGETAYDALRRAAGEAGIMVEAAYTPIYGSYYIEGINNLYEFDCGSESGWIYRVNNVTMGTGCSSYVVQEGDVISFLYTCKGLGEDLP